MINPLQMSYGYVSPRSSYDLDFFERGLAVRIDTPSAPSKKRRKTPRSLSPFAREQDGF
jgi:hypothetical protein